MHVKINLQKRWRLFCSFTALKNLSPEDKRVLSVVMINKDAFKTSFQNSWVLKSLSKKFLEQNEDDMLVFCLLFFKLLAQMNFFSLAFLKIFDVAGIGTE